MPRTAGESTPKYRKHKATAQAVVTISGRDHYLGPYGSKASRVEYDRLIGEWLAAGRRAVAVSDSNDLTVTELCKAYKAYAEAYYVRGGRLYNIATAMRAIRLRYGHTRATEFGPLALKAVRQTFVDDGKARKYCNSLIQEIRRAFKWAASEQLIPMGTWQSLTTVAGLRVGHTAARETEPIKPIDDSIVEATLPHMPAVVADMVRFQRATGARPAEVCAIRPGDVDRSGDVWAYRPRSHKTKHHGRDRVIFVGPKAQEVLRPYLLRSADAFCFSPAESERARKAVLRSNRKTPVQPSQLDRSKKRPKRKPGAVYNRLSYLTAIHRACDKAFPPTEKLEGDELKQWRSAHRWSPNRLRHTAATEIRKRFGLESAQMVLGHSKPNTTLIYAERDLQKAAAVIREVG
ncbi:MAG TPA: site-specific integrase [Pirellulales bacterium]|nr:site-specific integrase [Pirellulales bacterium]